jgi:hypothetical protein
MLTVVRRLSRHGLATKGRREQTKNGSLEGGLAMAGSTWQSHWRQSQKRRAEKHETGITDLYVSRSLNTSSSAAGWRRRLGLPQAEAIAEKGVNQSQKTPAYDGVGGISSKPRQRRRVQCQRKELPRAGQACLEKRVPKATARPSKPCGICHCIL